LLDLGEKPVAANVKPVPVVRLGASMTPEHAAFLQDQRINTSLSQLISGG
jgi:hypothetical protein